MKNILVILFSVILFYGCADEVNTTVPNKADEKGTEATPGSENPEPTQEEMTSKTMNLIATVLSPDDLGLKLNEDAQWVLPTESYTQLMKIKQQIYIISGNMESYEISSYNEMGTEFLEFVKTIPAASDELSNNELQKVISLTKEQCLIMLGSNKQQAQIAIINLSIIYDEIPNFFIGE